VVVGNNQTARPAKWTYYYLYVILDIFSRYVVGWMVASFESKTLTERLIAQTLAAQHITADQLTLHADRGSSMISKPVALLLADLGATKSHSRPHTSNDNPFSEAQFKTLKYRPDFPERFESIEAAECTTTGSFAGTTMNTNIPASRCTRPPKCITVSPTRSAGTAPPCSRAPTAPIPGASYANHPSHPLCQPSARSTRHRRRTNRLPKSPKIVSQRC
jgi:hypothetical protein